MFDSPGTADSPPPPPPSPGTPASPRYVHLLNRLRTRQITMEEATELFSLQQGMIRAAASASGAAAGGSGPRPSPAVGQPTVVGAPTDDLVWLSLLGVGTAAGLLAAMMKRFQEGPRATPSSGAVK